MRPFEHREGSIAAPPPNHIHQETTGAGAGIISITMTVLVLSGRRRRKREEGVGVDAGVGAGVSLVAGVAIAGHHPTAAKEKVGERGEGSKVGRCRV